MAQWIEHLTTDQKVGGSSPFGRTIVPHTLVYGHTSYTMTNGICCKGTVLVSCYALLRRFVA